MPKNIKFKLEDLRKEGLRITPQRKEIIDFLKNSTEAKHLSAESILTHLKTKNIEISRATLYRTLKLLSKYGVLQEVDFDENHKHYEYVKQEKHHHLMCKKCSQTFEFSDEKVDKLIKGIAKDKADFEITNFELKLFGVCKNCK